MNQRSRNRLDDLVSPIIAYTDLLFGMILILAFVISVLNVGWGDLEYESKQQRVRFAVESALPTAMRPRELAARGKNDPPGVQRWVFTAEQLFGDGETEVSPQGEDALKRFARVLREVGEWRRIRVEGHVSSRSGTNGDPWEESAALASKVVHVLQGAGCIEPWYLAIAGRADQDRINPVDASSPENERVELLLEYSYGPPYEPGGRLCAD
jgi:chemotaxis protein MotB